MARFTSSPQGAVLTVPARILEHLPGGHDQRRHGYRTNVVAGALIRGGLTGGESVRVAGGRLARPTKDSMVGGINTATVDPLAQSPRKSINEVKNWVRQNYALVQGDPSTYFGSWREGGKLWLDVSTNVPASVARQLGRERGELAIYHVASGTVESLTNG